MQFGASSENILSDNNKRIADPSEVVLDLYGRNYITDEYFDPTRLLNSDKLGVGPSNTTLTVSYRYNTSANSNAPAFSINTVDSLILEFKDELSLSFSVKNDIRNSFEVINEESIVGQTDDFSADELKTKIYGTYSAQARAVTEQDYQTMSYLMPGRFGKLKRVKAVRDVDELKRNLNLYVISQNTNGELVPSSTVLKNNLKTWLEKNKMINDTVDILDAKIVNFKINFSILSDLNVSKYEVLTRCLQALEAEYATKLDIGEPLIITNIYNTLRTVDGVVDVRNVLIEEVFGGNYSNFTFNFMQRMSPDKRYLSVPKNVIMELKYPKIDIKGNVI